jgi:DNA-binding transcriptional LysR family regulator
VIGPQLYDAMLGACRAAGFEPQVGMESPQLSSLANMVAAGFGVALVPASIGRIAAEGVGYHPLADGPPASAVALAHRLREKSATVLNLAALLKGLARA